MAITVSSLARTARADVERGGYSEKPGQISKSATQLALAVWPAAWHLGTVVGDPGKCKNDWSRIFGTSHHDLHLLQRCDTHGQVSGNAMQLVLALLPAA